MPPLLQTEAYATRLYEALPMIDEGAVRRRVELRGDDRNCSWSRRRPRTSTLFSTRRCSAAHSAPRRTSLEQLDHLIAVSKRRNVTIRVVPFKAGLHAGLQGQFTILQYADDRDRDVVAVESHTGERLLEQPSDVLEYLRIFDAITRKALDNDESRALIAEIRDRPHSPKGQP